MQLSAHWDQRRGPKADSGAVGNPLGKDHTKFFSNSENWRRRSFWLPFKIVSVKFGGQEVLWKGFLPRTLLPTSPDEQRSIVFNMWHVTDSLCSLLARPPLGFGLQEEGSGWEREERPCRTRSSVKLSQLTLLESSLGGMVFLTMEQSGQKRGLRSGKVGFGVSARATVLTSDLAQVMSYVCASESHLPYGDYRSTK